MTSQNSKHQKVPGSTNLNLKFKKKRGLPPPAACAKCLLLDDTADNTLTTIYEEYSHTNCILYNIIYSNASYSITI